jgi:lipopolysaccharide transport system ATP-binding protein
MSVRLAFAVAAHLEPEILLVDEVLAVGDAAFQRKSLGKMNEVAKEGRTVVFVSHNLAIIQALCSRGVLLERGEVITDAPIGEAIDTYLRTLERSAATDLLERTDRDSRAYDETLVRRLEISGPSGQANAIVAGQPATIAVEVTEELPSMECQLTIANSLGQPICTLDSEMSAPADVRDPGLGPRIECEIPALPLVPGRYRIDVIVKAKRQIQDGLQAATFFDVEPGLVGDRPTAAAGIEGSVVLPHVWRLPG